MASSNEDLWLIRTAENQLAGPYTRDQVCGLIHDGRLTHQDEVCSANGYWIYLHERDEVKKLLGVDMPKPAREKGDDEVTETDTRAEKTGDVIPDLPDVGEGTDLEQTSMMSNAALRTFQPRKKEAPSGKARAEVKSDAVEAARTPSEQPHGENKPNAGKPARGGNGASASVSSAKSPLKARLKRRWERFDKSVGGNGLVAVAIVAVAIGVFLVLRVLR